MTATRLLATGVLATSLSGCGFLLTKGPPTGHEHMPSFSCTEDNVGPALDIVWGSLNVLGAAIIAGDVQNYDHPDENIVVGLAWGAFMGFSAASGFKKTKECRSALRMLAARAESGAVQAVVITPVADTLAVGATLQLVAEARGSSGSAVPNRSFTWSSSNDAIASVSNAGLVTAHAPGSVVIAANTANVVGTARIHVRETR